MALTIDGLWAFNGAWRHIGENGFRVFDGSAWRTITDGWVFDGAWRKFYEVGPDDPTIDSSSAESDYDGDTSGFTDECDCECSVAKKSHCICINYNVSDCLLAHHVQFQMSLNGSSWYEESEKACSNSPLSQFCQSTQDGGNTSSCSTSTRYARVRIHDDTTHAIRATGSTHGPYNPSGCGAA